MRTMRVARNGESFDVVAETHDWFWGHFSNGLWEPGTFRLFDRFITRDTTVIDVGAWVGPTTLYCARRARRVIAFEPDPVAYDELTTNLAYNPDITNVTAVNAFVGRMDGPVQLGVKGEAGDSKSSALLVESGHDFAADAVTLDAALRQYHVQPPIFLKVDVEGYEYELMASIARVVRRYGGVALVSTHPEIFYVRQRRRMTPERRSSLLHRRLWSPVAWRARALTAGIRTVGSLSRGVVVCDESGRCVNLWSRLPRLVLRRDFTDEKTLLVSAGRM